MKKVQSALNKSIKIFSGLVDKVLVRKKGEEEQNLYTNYFGKRFIKNVNEFSENKKPLTAYVALENKLDNELGYSTIFSYDPSLAAYRNKALVEAARCMYHYVMLGDDLSQMYPTPRFILWSDANQYLALVLLVGWENKAQQMARLYEKSMHIFAARRADLVEGIVDGGDFRHAGAWFIFELARKYWGLTIDPEKVNYVDDFSVYQPVLDNWNTDDLTQVDAWVSRLCDRHMAEAVDHQKEDDGEFVGQNTEMFPYEILFWLRLRELSGLANPQHYTHPFMSAPQSTVPQLDWPTMPVFDNIFDQLSADYPQQLGISLAQQRQPPK